MGDVNSVLRHAVIQGKNYVYDVGSLSWVAMTQPGTSGGGGDASAANQALEIAALGATTDVEASGDGSIIALLKRLRTLLGGTLAIKHWDGTNVVQIRRLDSQVVSTDYGSVHHAVIHGLTTAGGGTYVDVKVNPSGALAVDGSGVTQPTKEVRAATVSQTSVNDSATSVTILASNANRLGATIFNDSSATLYLKLGATASTTSYTAKVVSGAYYEAPYGYTGVIDGIWASDPNDGAARITELTA